MSNFPNIIPEVFYENYTLATENPVSPKITGSSREGFVGGIPETGVNVIYPLIKAICSDRLTRNNTFYPTESLKTPKDAEVLDPTGYASFVSPYGKPVIAEHRLQDDNWSGVKGEAPFGRVIASTYMSWKQEGKDTAPRLHTKKGYPGFMEGTGGMYLIAAIDNQYAIDKILGNSFHTVSIGARVESVIESISGKDLVALSKKGETLPPYIRGQIYDNLLSHWIMKGVKGDEISYVNAPSDVLAGNKAKNLGKDGVRLLLGEKKVGSKEFNFFDAKTNEKIHWNKEEYAIDQSYFNNELIDSVERMKDKWLIGMGVTESYNSVALESMVTWGKELEGKVVAILTEGIPSIVNIKAKASSEDPIAIIRVYKAGKPTETHVVHKVKVLKLIGDK